MILTLNAHRRSFHTSPVTLESEYLIAGVRWTRTKVLDLHPEDREIAHWSILIDWDLQRSRPFVVIDPMDPSGLLYLNRSEYLGQAKVCASNELQLIVIARPKSRAPIPLSSDSSQNSPWTLHGPGKGLDWSNRETRKTWKTFIQLRYSVAKMVNRAHGSAMVSETKDSLVRSVNLWVRQLAHYAELRNPEATAHHFTGLVGYLQRLLASNGRMAVVLHLKLSLFVLYSFCSGNPIKSTMPLGWGIRLTRSGLPSCWGRTLRGIIKTQRIQWIRLMASFLNLYRSMEAPNKGFSVTTIEQPHPVLENSEEFARFQRFCRDVFPTLLASELGKSKLPLFEYESALGLIVQSAGANLTGPAMASIALDAKAWTGQPVNHVAEWFAFHKDREALATMGQCSLDDHFADNEMPAQIRYSIAGPLMATRMPRGHPACEKSQSAEIQPKDLILGRLHAIDEPAGKVRVVAICDYWTQVAMKPIHDFLFELLRPLSTDATFDQTGRTESYFNKGLSPHWSFDLKAATDLIPIALYREVLTSVITAKDDTSETRAKRIDLWIKVLTDRDFLKPDGTGFVRYNTGQPMGALSSWASMALVHHALVQFSAWKADASPRKWYQDYLVLGDDIDIAKREKVAKAYQESCSSFGIVIGILKSLRSNRNCFEFANQRFCPEGNISPLSFKEELQANTWLARLAFAQRILNRFGTSLKDESLALMRKASTAAQWKVLLPEISGVRPAEILQLFRFCLLNPFQKKEEFKIDSIIAWITPILNEEDKRKLTQQCESPEQRKKLERTAYEMLVQALLDQVAKKLARVPVRWSARYKGYRQATLDAELRNPCEAHISIRCLYDGLELSPKLDQPAGHDADYTWYFFKKFLLLYPTEEEYSWKGFFETKLFIEPMTILYLLDCVDTHNQKTVAKLNRMLRELEELKRSFEDHYGFFRFWTDPARAEFAKDLNKEVIPPLGRALRIWDELSNSSTIIEPDFNRWVGDWLKVEEAPSPLKALFRKSDNRFLDRVFAENLRGPWTSIAIAIARLTGVRLSPVPYVIRDGGAKWRRELQAAIDSWNEEVSNMTPLTVPTETLVPEETPLTEERAVDPEPSVGDLPEGFTRRVTEPSPKPFLKKEPVKWNF